MKSLYRNFLGVVLCAFALLIQSCGSSGSGGASGSSSDSKSGGGTVSVKDITISGSMSLTGTTSSNIIGNGIFSLAASVDTYKLYCVTFEDPPDACTLTVTKGAFSKACGSFADTPFGCFALDSAEAVYPLIADQGLGCSGGGEILLTIEFDPVTGIGKIVSKIKEGKKVEVSADSLADLSVWEKGLLYNVAFEKDKLLQNVSPKAQQGPPPAYAPPNPQDMGPRPGASFDMFLKLYGSQLLVASKDITHKCKYDTDKKSFVYTISNGTQSVAFDISSIEKYEESWKSALKGSNRVFSEALEDGIMKVQEARVADRFGHCSKLDDTKNNPISEKNCVLAYVNPTYWMTIAPPQAPSQPEREGQAPYQPSAWKAPGEKDLVKVDKSTHAIVFWDYRSGKEQRTFRPAVEAVNVSSVAPPPYPVPPVAIAELEQSTAGQPYQPYIPASPRHEDAYPPAPIPAQGKHFEEIFEWCPDPFQKGQLNNFSIDLKSQDETITHPGAIALLTVGEGAQRLKADSGCDDQAKNDELRRELGQVFHELFEGEFLDHFQEDWCTQFLSAAKIEETKKYGQQVQDSYTNDGPVHNRPDNQSHFGSVATHAPNTPTGYVPYSSPPPTPTPVQNHLAQSGPVPAGTPSGTHYDPALLQCAKFDGNDKDFSDVDAKGYLLRFMPPGQAILCSLSKTLKDELKLIAKNSCFPRGVNVQHICNVRSEKEGAGMDCRPQLMITHLSPADAHDIMNRDKNVPAPRFAFESLQSFKQLDDRDGDGVPKSCEYGFGVTINAKLPKEGQKVLLATDVIKDGRFTTNDTNTCGELQADTGGEFKVEKQKQDANRAMSFTATPK